MHGRRQRGREVGHQVGVGLDVCCVADAWRKRGGCMSFWTRHARAARASNASCADPLAAWLHQMLHGCMGWGSSGSCHRVAACASGLQYFRCVVLKAQASWQKCVAMFIKAWPWGSAGCERRGHRWNVSAHACVIWRQDVSHIADRRACTETPRSYTCQLRSASTDIDIACTLQSCGDGTSGETSVTR
jgi:hypothetical protein